MPLIRKPDGKIVEEKTRLKSKNDVESSPGSAISEKINPPGNIGGRNIESGDARFYEKKTVKVGSSKVTEYPPVEDGKTRLVWNKGSESGESDAMADPVVGWLVVIDGPGCGNAHKLGYGTNGIGRSGQDRVSLDYGDDRISRSNHAIVTFDPKGKKFYVQQGGGTNLTYVGETPVLQPVMLKHKDDIVIGDTTLKLIALCGEDFDWQSG